MAITADSLISKWRERTSAYARPLLILAAITLIGSFTVTTYLQLNALRSAIVAMLKAVNQGGAAQTTEFSEALKPLVSWWGLLALTLSIVSFLTYTGYFFFNLKDRVNSVFRHVSQEGKIRVCRSEDESLSEVHFLFTRSHLINTCEAG